MTYVWRSVVPETGNATVYVRGSDGSVVLGICDIGVPTTVNLVTETIEGTGQVRVSPPGFYTCLPQPGKEDTSRSGKLWSDITISTLTLPRVTWSAKRRGLRWVGVGPVNTQVTSPSLLLDETTFSDLPKVMDTECKRPPEGEDEVSVVIHTGRREIDKSTGPLLVPRENTVTVWVGVG